MQARYLTSKHPNPHLLHDGDTFDPSEVDAIDSYKKHDWVASIDFFHESLCLFYYRFARNNTNNLAQTYLEEKCTCNATQESKVSAIHVKHHEEGHRTSLIDLSTNIKEKIKKLTKIDRIVYKHILQDFIADIVWVESKNNLDRRILCDQKLDFVNKELAYLDFNVTETYHYLLRKKKEEKHRHYVDFETEENDSTFYLVAAFQYSVLVLFGSVLFAKGKSLRSRIF